MLYLHDVLPLFLLLKVIALINRQLRKAARAIDGNDEDNLTDVDDTVNDDDADHGGMVVAEEKEEVADAHRDHDAVDRNKGGDAGGGSSQKAPPLPSEPYKASTNSSSSSAATSSRNSGGGGGGGGGGYKKLVNDDGTLISENILHKDQRGVVMVFEELTPRQVEALSFLVTSFPRTRYLLQHPAISSGSLISIIQQYEKKGNDTLPPTFCYLTSLLIHLSSFLRL